MKPEIKLTQKDKNSVKRVAQTLLQRLKAEKLVLDWRKRQQARAAVRLTIEMTLDELPQMFNRELFARKCDLVYQHVFDSYQDAGHSIYQAAS